MNDLVGLGAVCFPAVSDLDDQNQQDPILDLVNDPEVAYSNTIEIVAVGKLCAGARSRVKRESVNHRAHPFLHRLGQFVELPQRSRLEFDRIGHRLQPALLLDRFPSNRAWFL